MMMAPSTDAYVRHMHTVLRGQIIEMCQKIMNTLEQILVLSFASVFPRQEMKVCRGERLSLECPRGDLLWVHEVRTSRISIIALLHILYWLWGCIFVRILFEWLQLSTWWRHQMETFSELLALCVGNSPVTGEFPSQRPEPQSFDVFFDLRLIKRLSKRSWGWWFETPSLPLWGNCNDETSFLLNIHIAFMHEVTS